MYGGSYKISEGAHYEAWRLQESLHIYYLIHSNWDVWIRTLARGQGD
jgi:hypothetical protein